MACHSVLARVSTESLNGILSATSPQDSSQFCKTMTGFMLHSCPPPMRAKILDVIAYKRLDEITIANRAVIIRAIQRCLLSPLHTEKAVLHAAACSILRSTYGHELSMLKEQIHLDDDLVFGDGETPETFNRDDANDAALADDMSTLPHSGDLPQLVFGNKNVTEVVQVMQHIAVEALKVQQESPALVKVVSDIDDTLYPGWLDRRYPLHVPYPGVSELYARLSRSLGDETKGGDKLPPSITFLTARPRGWLSMGRYLTIQHLRSLGVPHATVLNGSVQGLVSSKKIADVKMENFRRFASLFPEFKFVFFGDSGQGDALLASRLLQSCEQQVLATFIHDVTPGVERTGDGQRKDVYRAQGVQFFETYPGASLEARAKGLLSDDDVRAVCRRAHEELSDMLFVGSDSDVKKAQRSRELDEELARIHRELS
ncbi:hypothetical protein PINS_up007363 [Pythium insidiosum]|nr:hypothetical protein PINS_up007363 [Pythium insidiosum]